MVLSVTEQSLFNNLRQTHNLSLSLTSTLNDYYEGDHILEQLGLSIPDELRRFAVWVSWPRVVVDAKEQRLDVTGFRMPGNASADRALWETWQYNNMDERQTFAHTDALALSRSYACVGTNDEDREHPLITIESPTEMIAVRDPRTHRVSSALRLYDVENGQATRATLYLPNVTRWLKRDDIGQWDDEREPDRHNLGTVPVVPFVNRNRPTRRSNSILEGISEMADVIPLADSAARALTNAQVAQETHAVPQRGVLGATRGDFVGPDNEPLDVWRAYFSGIWALGNPDAKTFQFDASDMKNFETMINTYARQASGVTGLPIEYFGLNTQNPPSAEGQRAGETRLIKSAERKQTTFGASWEAVMRLVIRFRDGAWSDDARRMECLWRDAGTPTRAQVTDAVVKEFQAGLTDWETAQEDLGRSPETIARMRARRQAETDAALSFGVQRATEEA